MDADVDCLLSMAKSLKRCHLESCTSEDFAALASPNLLNNIEDLTLVVGGGARPELRILSDSAMAELIGQIFEQPCNKLTNLRLVGVELAAFEERAESGKPITLPKCLKHLEIRHSEIQLDEYFPQEESVLLILKACPTSLETLILHTEVNVDRIILDFPKLRKLELGFLSRVGTILNHTRNLEELSLTINVFIGLRELVVLPARMPRIKSLKIFTHSSTSEGNSHSFREKKRINVTKIIFKY